jgi:hypothetical protein
MNKYQVHDFLCIALRKLVPWYNSVLVLDMYLES